MLSAGPLVWPRLCDWRFLVTCDAGKTEPSLPLARAPTAPPEGPAARGPPFSLSTSLAVVLTFLQEEDVSSLRASWPLVWGTVISVSGLAPPPGTPAWPAPCSQPRRAPHAQPLTGPTTAVALGLHAPLSPSPQPEAEPWLWLGQVESHSDYLVATGSFQSA